MAEMFASYGLPHLLVALLVWFLIVLPWLFVSLLFAVDCAPWLRDRPARARKEREKTLTQRRWGDAS